MGTKTNSACLQSNSIFLFFFS
uniref:Uncharacterized protein n=1 Tax=Rhizophora mucronata TaxID=61149 RepID=A0A2P2P375_RHIMU